MTDNKVIPATKAIAAVESESKPLYMGRTGEWWDAGLIISLVAAAIAAGAVLIFTTGSITAHKREAEDSDRRVRKLVADAEVAKSTVAKANEAAAKANLEIARLTTPRSLSEENRAKIKAAISGFAGQRFSLSVAPDPESINFLTAIDSLLKESGWQLINAQIGDIQVGDAGQAFGFGVIIHIPTGAADLLPAARALEAALIKAELKPVILQFNPQLKVFNAINVMVGAKN